MESILASEPDKVQNEQSTDPAYTQVVSRSLPLLAILSGLYIFWFYEPRYPYGDVVQWMTHASQILVMGGAVAWSVLELARPGYTGHRFHPLVGGALMILFGTLLNSLARLSIYLLDPPHWPEMGITYEAFNLQEGLMLGFIMLCSYAILFRRMHKLTFRNLVIYWLCWYALTKVILITFICISYGIRLNLQTLYLEFATPLLGGKTLAVAHLTLTSGGLFAAWWLARHVVPVNADLRQTRGTAIGDVICDFIDNRLSLAPTFWYVGMIGGHLVTLPLLVTVFFDISIVAALVFLSFLVLFWAWVFLRILQASESYSGSSFWVVCAVVVTGSQLAANLVGAILISRELMF